MKFTTATEIIHTVGVGFVLIYCSTTLYYLYIWALTFQNDMEAAREAYDAFLSHYPYCYGYWRKYADYEKRKGNKKKCEEVRIILH